MAIQKTISTEYGSNTTATYWKISYYKSDTILNIGEAQLLGYVSKTESDNNNTPIATRHFKWEANNPFILKGYDILDPNNNQVIGHQYGLDETNPIELAYIAIKTQKTTEIQDGREVVIDSPFADAVDVLEAGQIIIPI